MPLNQRTFFQGKDNNRPLPGQSRKKRALIFPLELIEPLLFAFLRKLVWRTHSNISQQITVAYSQLLLRSLASWKLQLRTPPASHQEANRRD